MSELSRSRQWWSWFVFASVAAGCGANVQPEDDVSTSVDGSRTFADVAGDEALADAAVSASDATANDGAARRAQSRFAVVRTRYPTDNGDRVYGARLLPWDDEANVGVRSVQSGAACAVDSELFPAFGPPGGRMEARAGTGLFVGTVRRDGETIARPSGPYFAGDTVEVIVLRPTEERWSTSVDRLPFVNVEAEQLVTLVVPPNRELQFHWTLEEPLPAGALVEFRLTTLLWDPSRRQYSYSILRCDAPTTATSITVRLDEHPAWRRPRSLDDSVVLTINTVSRHTVSFFDDELAIVESRTENLVRPVVFE
jgi:hypothetical protein